MTWTTASGARWARAEVSDAATRQLVEALGVSELLARILVQRGYSDPDHADRFLNPRLEDLHPPELLPDFEVAAESVLGAIERKERIFVHGDYDVDGMTSAALLTRFLEKVGANVRVHVPHRVKEGYGIHASAVEMAHREGTRLFLTCDCGISAFPQIERARELGMTVVVTDHHELKSTLPAAHAIVNPHRPDSAYPFPEISGVGVAFKFCAGLATRLGIDLKNYYRAYLDLVTLGTIADVMPLVDENRIFVANGLSRIQESQKPGIQALLRVSETKKVTARAVGFGLAPRLNAVGRMDDAGLGLRLLLSREEDEAARLASEINDMNQLRRAEQDRMVAEAEAMILELGLLEHAALVVGKEDWHPGIIGIVAGRLVDRYYRPAFVVNLASGKGSARSIPGYHLASALQRADDLLAGHGGHELAAGFSVLENEFDALRRHLQSDAGSVLSESQLVRQLVAEDEVTLAECTLASVEELERLQPFGHGNSEPTFWLRNVSVLETVPTRNPAHVHLRVADSEGRNGKLIAFGKAELMQALEPGQPVEALVRLERNEWNGNVSAQYGLIDLSTESN